MGGGLCAGTAYIRGGLCAGVAYTRVLTVQNQQHYAKNLKAIAVNTATLTALHSLVSVYNNDLPKV